MAESLGQAILELRTDDKRYNKGLRDAARLARQTDQRFDRSTRNMERSFRRLGGVVKFVVSAYIAKQFVDLTNSYQQLEGQLRVVEKSQAAANERFEQLHQLANDTRASLAATTTVYTRLARANRQFGASQQQLLQFTETLNKAVAASGASAEEARAAMIQFSQGMASGQLRGEELRSVMEQLPRLAIAIADGLRIEGVGALRQMAEQGELTAERVFAAVMDQQDAIAREFNQLPRRVDQALTQLGNDMLAAFGKADVEGLVKAIDGFRDIVTDPEFVAAVTSLAEATFNFLGGTAQLIKDVHQYWREYQEGVARTEARRAVIKQAEHVQNLTDKLRRMREELGSNYPTDKPISILGGRTLDDLRQERDTQLEILKTLERQRRALEETASLGVRQAGAFDPIKQGADDANESLTKTATLLEQIDAKREQLIKKHKLETPPAGWRLVNPMEASAPLVPQDVKKAAKEVEDHQLALTEQQRELNRAAENTGFAFRSAFADAIVEGQKLRGVLKGLARDLMQILFRQTAGAAISNAVQSAVIGVVSGGSGGSGGVGQNVPVLKGSREHGGPVTAGRDYLVGENGPEVFSPDRSGYVNANGAGRGVTIQYADLRGASEAAVARLEQWVAGLDGTIEQRAVGAVAEDYANGGALRGVMG